MFSEKKMPNNFSRYTFKNLFHKVTAHFWFATYELENVVLGDINKPLYGRVLDFIMRKTEKDWEG